MMRNGNSMTIWVALDLIKGIVERTFSEVLTLTRYFATWASVPALGIFSVFSLGVETLKKDKELSVVEIWATKFT